MDVTDKDRSVRAKLVEAKHRHDRLIQPVATMIVSLCVGAGLNEEESTKVRNVVADLISASFEHGYELAIYQVSGRRKGSKANDDLSNLYRINE